jgi:predicted RNA-binding Zn-ribbon protein involved in translation (DUF1610 family)
MTMHEDALWLDGNGIAGLLAEVFETDMTAVDRGCATCGAHRVIGAHRAYRSAGTVLRCPVCGDLAARISTLPDRHVVRLAGSWLLEVPRGGHRPAAQ